MIAYVNYENKEVEIVDDFTLPELIEFIRNTFGSVENVKIKVRVLYMKNPALEKEIVYVPVYPWYGLPYFPPTPLYPLIAEPLPQNPTVTSVTGLEEITTTVRYKLNDKTQ